MLLLPLLNILMCNVDDQLMMIFLSLLAIGDISGQAGGQKQVAFGGAKAAGEIEKKQGEITGGKAVVASVALN